MINALSPAIYKLKYDKKEGYRLEYYSQHFSVTGKNYGDINNHVDIFWNTFIKSKNSLGVMLTGAAGSGKTRVGEILSNLGIDHGMAVVMVTEVTINIELVPFIDSLHNMVVLFDEFSKNIPMRMQSKMLTMFSSIGPNKKLFIITENESRSVSPFIRCRPGRIRYAVDYDRIKENVVNEYCKDHSASSGIVEEIIKLRSKASKFTFDHLQAIVSEHIEYPNKTIEDLLDILNLDGLVAEDSWDLNRIFKTSDGSKWVSQDMPSSFSKDDMESKYFGARFYITRETSEKDDQVGGADKQSIRITPKDLVRIDEDQTYVYHTGDFDVYLSKS